MRRHVVVTVSSLALAAVMLTVTGWAKSKPKARKRAAEAATFCSACTKGANIPPELLQAESLERIRSQYFADHGTRIQVSPSTPPELRQHQEELAAELSQLAPVPDDRKQHFSWLANVPRLRCNGWSGIIQEVLDRPDGTFVTVTVAPLLSLPEGGAHSAGTTVETYKRTVAGWSYIGGRPASNYRVLIIN